MKRFTKYVFFTLLLAFSGCGNGADTIPGLSKMIISSLKENKEADFEKTLPTSEELVNFYHTYYTLDYPNEHKREAEAIGKAGSIRLSMLNDFRKVRTQAQKLNINWQTAKLMNFNFVKGDHNQGFPAADVRLLIGTSDHTEELTYRAYQVGGRWYLVDDLQWTNSPSAIPPSDYVPTDGDAE